MKSIFTAEYAENAERKHERMHGISAFLCELGVLCGE